MASDDLLPEIVVVVGCEEYASPDSVSLVAFEDIEQCQATNNKETDYIFFIPQLTQ